MVELVVKEVCKICFNASSQKTNPTLTPVEKMIQGTGSKQCPNCKQNWNGIKVVRDNESNKWVVVRPRPLKLSPHIDYQLCSSILKKQQCQKGPGACTFAHSILELQCWNRERYREPRPLPVGMTPNQILFCKRVLADGSCPFGQRCQYAHSEEERDRWSEQLTDNVVFTNHRQFDDHMTSQRHRHFAAMQAGTSYQQQIYGSNHPPRHSIRPIPDRLPANGFRMCVRIESSRGCFYGIRCTFAHSEAELEAWNRQAKQYRNQRIVVGSIPKTYTGNNTKQEFGVSSPSQASPSQVSPLTPAVPGPIITPVAATHDASDFTQRLRTTVMMDYQDKQNAKEDLRGFEKTLQNVTIIEVSGHEMGLMISDNAGNISWIFEVSATTPRILESVVLFDMLAPEFSIDAIDLVMFGGHTKPLNSHSKADQDSGFLVEHRITPPDKLRVKISLKPRPGVLGQMVIFDFGSFYMVRYLCVDVVNEQDRRLLASATTRKQTKNKPDKLDYFWEQSYSSNPSELFGIDNDDMTGDSKLPEHQLPKVIEELIEKGKYDNMQRKVVQKTYIRRMHNLLFLEEFQERKDLSRYDLYDVELQPQSVYTTVGEIINDPSYSFVTVEMDELLFEGGRSIRNSDHCMMLLHPSTTGGQPEVHKCMVHSIMRDSVVLKMSKQTAEMCALSGNTASIRFQPSRIRMRAMHESLEKADISVVFPDTNQELEKSDPTLLYPILSSSNRHCLNEVEQSRLNELQKNAIRSVVDPSYRKIPTIITGPFGCGKTETMAECIKLLSLHDHGAKILVCTHNNSAADIYVRAIHEEFANKRNTIAPMLRLYYSERNPRTVDRTVLQYCKMRNDKFYNVSSSELTPYSVVVTTTMTARMLWLNGVDRGYFTHVFIDEAAQVLETEVLVALCLADKNTKIVLAGDSMQTEPPVHSTYAKKYGLDVSMLERLCSDALYDTEVASNCKIELFENHRSHHDILHLPSKLFYKSSLVCKAVFPENGPKNIPNLQFVGVDGYEAQEPQSPSYYNDQEVVKVAEEVSRFYNGGQGLDQKQICVLSYYELQVKRIRSYLRSRYLSDVEVQRIDGIQGREYRALIISTVRTCSSLHNNDVEDDDGFLNNVKFFNTAITRAREWLVIVGEPITLCTVGYNTSCWIELLEYCIEKNTFRYQCPNNFMKYLETRVISRQIMVKNHGDFLKKSTAPAEASKILSQPVATELRPSPLHASQQQQQQQIRNIITKCLQTSDESLTTTILGEVLKFSPFHLSMFMSQPEVAAKYVRDYENMMKSRSNELPNKPISSTHEQPSVQPQQSKTLTAMGDLPPFLRSQVEALTQHLRYCDTQKCTNPLALHVLNDQKKLLSQQMALVNQQIIKYREFLKKNSLIVHSNPPQPQSQPQPQPRPPLLNHLVPNARLPMAAPAGTLYHHHLQQMGGANNASMYGIGGMMRGGARHQFNPYNTGYPSGYSASINQPSPGSFGTAAGQYNPQSVGGLMGGQQLLSSNPNINQPPTQSPMSYQDQYISSQPTYRQTTQLVSPINNLISNQTWNGDDID